MKQPRLKELYRKEVTASLQNKQGYTSVMQVPRLVKICINQGLGSAVNDKKIIDVAVEELMAITGQRPVPTLSRKAISNFKLRENMPIGVRVTLRGDKMYEFMDRLVSIAIPRIRDFRGLPKKGFDGRGNYTLGIKEQIIFPEISMDKVNKLMGMSITFATTAQDDEGAFALLHALGMPFHAV